jgi:hypothetical protein
LSFIICEELVILLNSYKYDNVSISEYYVLNIFQKCVIIVRAIELVQ